MKIGITKANAFQIDPKKKYLVLVTNHDNMMTLPEIDDLNDTLHASIGNNLTLVVLPDGAKFRVLETANDQPA